MINAQLKRLIAQLKINRMTNAVKEINCLRALTLITVCHHYWSGCNLPVVHK